MLRKTFESNLVKPLVPTAAAIIAPHLAIAAMTPPILLAKNLIKSPNQVGFLTFSEVIVPDKSSVFSNCVSC